MQRCAKNVIAILFVCVLLAGSIVGLRTMLPARTGSIFTAQQIAEKTPLDLKQADFAGLAWTDLARVMSVSQNGDAGLALILKRTANSKNDATKYLHGILLIADGKPEEALQAFDSIAIENIPPTHLYASYRLHGVLSPGTSNPYLERLRLFTEQNRLPPLMRGRVLARVGKLKQSLQSYLATDPADWVRHDAECLALIGQHSGLESEVKGMILAAISGGRIQQETATFFSTMAFRTDRNKSIENHFQQQFCEASNRGDDGGSVGVKSVREILTHRRLFTSRRCRELLDSSFQADPTELTTEYVLMLFLSALHEKDRPLGTRWGQELKRRHPESEAIRWVERLTNSAFPES